MGGLPKFKDGFLQSSRFVRFCARRRVVRAELPEHGEYLVAMLKPSWERHGDNICLFGDQCGLANRWVHRPELDAFGLELMAKGPQCIESG